MMLRLLSLFSFLCLTSPAFAAYDELFAEEPQQATRNLFQLTTNDAQAAIAQALSEKGAGNKVAATMQGQGSNVVFSYNKPVTAEIQGLTFDAATRRWNASLLFRSGEDVVSAIPASGTYQEIIDVPVLKREARNNLVISENDIEMRSFPLAQTRSDTVTDMRQLLGKSPLRFISAQRPIRVNEISNPAVVKKNSMVQLEFVSSGIQISTAGQALEDGAIGDVINVRNTASKRVVRAVVQSEGLVRVESPGNMPSRSMTNNTTTELSQGGAYAAN